MKALTGRNSHRDIITGLAFRENTHELFTCSFDRTVKLWSLDEMAYVDTLFGHQAEVRGGHFSWPKLPVSPQQI